MYVPKKGLADNTFKNAIKLQKHCAGKKIKSLLYGQEKTNFANICSHTFRQGQSHKCTPTQSKSRSALKCEQR